MAMLRVAVVIAALGCGNALAGVGRRRAVLGGGGALALAWAKPASAAAPPAA